MARYSVRSSLILAGAMKSSVTGLPEFFVEAADHVEAAVLASRVALAFNRLAASNIRMVCSIRDVSDAASESVGIAIDRLDELPRRIPS